MPRKNKLADAQAAAVDTAVMPAPETITTPPELREPGIDVPAVKKPFMKHKSDAHDDAAGVEIMQHVDTTNPIVRERNQIWLRFREKPSQEVVRLIKETVHKEAEKRELFIPEEDFHYDKKAQKGGGNFDVEGAWIMKHGFADRGDKHDIMLKTYHVVRNKMREMKGLEQDNYIEANGKGRE